MLQSRWRDYFENILVAIFLALFVRTFILTSYKVPTDSMSPTLIAGDFIFAYRLPYGLRLPLTQTTIRTGVPKRQEVIVFSFPQQPKVNFVKRIVGTPGDLIEIRNGQLHVNGALAAPEKIYIESFGPLVVPPDEVFVLSDQDTTKEDSRYWGTVPYNYIIGKVLLVWLSVDWEKKNPDSYLPAWRTERFFSTVH